MLARRVPVVWRLLLVLGLLGAGRVSGLACSKTGPCSCSSANGDINLSPLDGHGAPRFKDQPTTNPMDTWQYSWNPCSPFTEGTCTGVSGCQVAKTGGESYTLGTQDSATFLADPSTDNVILQYTATEGGTLRTLNVALICDPSTEANLTVLGEATTLVYEMTLQSKYCCPGASTSSEGLSAGSILLILFFTLTLVYIVGGVLFMVFVRKASGREAVPNYSFWSTLPGLIKDGMLFTFRSVCSLCGRRQSYDKI